MSNRTPRYPRPLNQGSCIALTAFSAGVNPPMHKRLDRVIADFRERGYRVIEGQCLRQSVHHTSADAPSRARELMTFLLDDRIDAVVPPWGGEFAMELLPYLDFDALAQTRPKWLFGFSDVSTIAAPIYARCGWATVHCANFMELLSIETEPMTQATLNHLMLSSGTSFTQHSSEHYQEQYPDFSVEIEATLKLSAPTRWRLLHGDQPIAFEGRLIGGCLDTLFHLFGSRYLDFSALKRTHSGDGTILYFENAELHPTDLVRALLNMRFRGVFDGLNGVLIGRNSAQSSSPDKQGFSYLDALHKVLGDIDIPVLFDLDIGHQPPNLTLINGAFTSVTYSAGKGSIHQTLC